MILINDEFMSMTRLGIECVCYAMLSDVIAWGVWNGG